MNRQEARAYALREVASFAEHVEGNGYQMTDSEENDRKVFREIEDVVNELRRRADQIERNLTLKPKRSKKR
jgi:hypothetical protein